MPEYEFKRPNGQRITEFFPMGEAPEPGISVLIRGERCIRVYSLPQTHCAPDPRHVAHSLEPYHPDAPHLDSEGQPEFHTRKEIDEFAAKTGRVYR